MRLTLLLCLLPGALAAQAPDTSKAAHTIPVTDSVLRLPVDRASDLLPWVAGGSLDPDGAPSWHAFGAQRFDRVTDGVRWASGMRSRGPRGINASPVVLEPALNSLDRAELSHTMRGPATFLFATRSGPDRWSANGSSESEDPVRATGGSGFSRFEGSAGGPLLGAFRFRAAGTLLGRRSAPTGVDYASSPFYVPTGIDTTFRYADPSSLPDSIDAIVQRFGTTSSVPYSPLSTADWTMRVDGRLGRVTLWAHWLGTSVAERTFNYFDAANPIQAKGSDRSGRDLAAGMVLPLTGGFSVEGSVGLQHERSEQGPLTSAAEFDSRDPTLGLMLGGVDLRWDFDNFPVDAQLLSNYRNNTPGSRRSPYDLENTAQYSLIDQYRNSAYGLYGWSEAGGPQGVLALDQDARLFASAAVTKAAAAGYTFRLGVEVVRHDMQHYSHSLTSQAFSDVWLAKPTESALLADWTWDGRGWRLTAGARIDRFQTGATRPFLLDTFAGSPTVGMYQYFPRISSYGKNDPVLQHFLPDEAHTAFAPHVTLSGELGGGVVGRLNASRTARMPDLAYSLAGVNTDWAITNSAAAFGTDMGHEITDLYEIGISGNSETFRWDVALFDDELKKVVSPKWEQPYDPARNSPNLILLNELVEGRGGYRGLTVSTEWQATSWLHANGTYRYTESHGAALGPFGPYYPEDDVRPNTLTLSALMQAPAAGPLSGFGALVSYRTMSGTARLVDIPGPTYPFNASVRDGVPNWSSVDLRVSKSLPMGGRRLTVYADTRNLFNAANFIRAFAGGDPVHFGTSQDLAWSNDSAWIADEAKRSGEYDNATGTIDLTFGGAGRGGCGAWVTASNQPSPPNCAYLIAAEQRFGNGDGTYTLAEQRSASHAFYATQYGRNAFTGPGRSLRIGAQVAF